MDNRRRQTSVQSIIKKLEEEKLKSSSSDSVDFNSGNIKTGGDKSTKSDEVKEDKIVNADAGEFKKSLEKVLEKKARDVAEEEKRIRLEKLQELKMMEDKIEKSLGETKIKIRDLEANKIGKNLEIENMILEENNLEEKLALIKRQHVILSRVALQAVRHSITDKDQKKEFHKENIAVTKVEGGNTTSDLVTGGVSGMASGSINVSPQTQSVTPAVTSSAFPVALNFISAAAYIFSFGFYAYDAYKVWNEQDHTKDRNVRLAASFTSAVLYAGGFGLGASLAFNVGLLSVGSVGAAVAGPVVVAVGLAVGLIALGKDVWQYRQTQKKISDLGIELDRLSAEEFNHNKELSRADYKNDEKLEAAAKLALKKAQIMENMEFQNDVLKQKQKAIASDVGMAVISVVSVVIAISVVAVATGGLAVAGAALAATVAGVTLGLVNLARNYKERRKNKEKLDKIIEEKQKDEAHRQEIENSVVSKLTRQASIEGKLSVKNQEKSAASAEMNALEDEIKSLARNAAELEQKFMGVKSEIIKTSKSIERSDEVLRKTSSSDDNVSLANSSVSSNFESLGRSGSLKSDTTSPVSGGRFGFFSRAKSNEDSKEEEKLSSKKGHGSSPSINNRGS